MNQARLCYIIHQGDCDLARLKAARVQQWLSELPGLKQASLRRLVHISDCKTSLLATRLLKICAQEEGIENFQLRDINYPGKGKPGWVSKAGCFFDFNLTHSEKLIAVAASKTMNVGIDAERIRELKNLNFKMVLSADELTEIQQTPDLFFELWSKKEAVVKAANTTGLGRMRDVQLNHNHAVLDNRKWYLKKIELNTLPGNQYAIYLATSEPVDEVIVKQVEISELISR